ncbi:1,2-phenylacetyl-CoA epoxidase subunit PaaD [Ottowia pentelensis]|uniref:1,2-phenylacetyl-CoA epoxidase subunit PaaD n=1 Tax=Ottowia pentelensis TaxID=511108 RepID=A0ABV6PTV0_9BURK
MPALNAPALTPALSQREREQTPEFAALWNALDELTDPEIPVVTLREMGILRALRVGDDGVIEVVITPTYSGCPAMEQIHADILATLRRQGVAGRVVTQLAPAWTTDWISEAAREKLRAWGIAPPHAARADGLAVIHLAPNMRAAGACHTGVRASFDSKPVVMCPQCGSANTTEISHFGSTACKALYRCLDCMEPFDHFKNI